MLHLPASLFTNFLTKEENWYFLSVESRVKNQLMVQVWRILDKYSKNHSLFFPYDTPPTLVAVLAKINEDLELPDFKRTDSEAVIQEYPQPWSNWIPVLKNYF